MAAEEFIDEVDSAGNVIATHPKSALRERMFLHNVSLVIPRDREGRLILGKRAKDKWPYPNLWVCAWGGKASSGESAEQAAARETREEVGRALPLVRVLSFLYDQDDYKALFTLFTSAEPVEIPDLKVDPREIQSLRAFWKEELEELVTSKPDEFATTFRAALTEFLAKIDSRSQPG